MSKAALVAVVAAGRGTLGASAYAVLIQLAWHLNARTGRLDMSQERLAGEIGRDVRTVKRGVAELRRAGLIRMRHRKNATATYELAVPHERHEAPSKQGQEGTYCPSLTELGRDILCRPEGTYCPTNLKRTADDAAMPSGTSSSATKGSDRHPPTAPRATGPSTDPAPDGREGLARDKGSPSATVHVHPMRLLVEAQQKAATEAEARRQEEARQRQAAQHSYQAALTRALASGIPPDPGEDTRAWIARVAP